MLRCFEKEKGTPLKENFLNSQALKWVRCTCHSSQFRLYRIYSKNLG